VEDSYKLLLYSLNPWLSSVIVSGLWWSLTSYRTRCSEVDILSDCSV